MRPDVFELHDFYGSRQGLLVRRLLNREIRSHWPDLKGQHVLGLGHATPFMGPLARNAERAAVIMPKAQGVMRWPKKRPNMTALGIENDLPIADRSVDRVLIVHALEQTERAGRLLREVWRILADDGEIIAIVPNRRGLWCLSERTPFGQGRPYSSTQLKTAAARPSLRAAKDRLRALRSALSFEPAPKDRRRLGTRRFAGRSAVCRRPGDARSKANLRHARRSGRSREKSALPMLTFPRYARRLPPNAVV